MDNLDKNLYKVYNNVLLMLKNRGYRTDPSISTLKQNDLENSENDLENSENINVNNTLLEEYFLEYDTFKNMSTDELTIKIPNTNVYFLNESKIGVKSIRNCVDESLGEEKYHIILIVKDSITPYAKTEITTIMDSDENNKIFIELFNFEEKMIDIIQHVLVPKHIPLTTAQKKEVLDKYSVKEGQIAKILTTDPITKYYGLKKSDMFRIDRISETAGIYTTYRIVS